MEVVEKIERRELKRGQGEVKEKGKDKKKSKKGVVKNEKQSKFFVDLSKEQVVLDSILAIIAEANNRSFGREITFKDLAVYAVPKLSAKDIERIQEATLTDMERVQRLLEDYNQKNSTSISMGEFLVKRMNILKEGK